MSASRTALFMNQNAGVREWFLREPSLTRVKELGFDIRFNERDERLEPAEWAELVAGYEVLLTTWGSPKLDAEVLAKNDTLKIVGHVGGSVAAQVSPELYERGVRVTTANPLMARSVAEATLMLMLMGLRQTNHTMQLGTRSEKMNWGVRKDNIRVTESVVVGIWGFGEIAQFLLDMLGALTPKEVLVSSGHLSDADAKAKGMRKVGFDDLFAQADVIVCLAGMTEANRGRVGPDQLKAIQDGGVLINVGRAHLIQEEALIAALKEDRFVGVFDVYHKEPLPEDHPFTSLPNVLLSPHNAGTGRDAMYLAAMLDEIDRFYKGEPLKYEIAQSRAIQMTDPAAMR